jgi:hypothetical protein
MAEFDSIEYLKLDPLNEIRCPSNGATERGTIGVRLPLKFAFSGRFVDVSPKLSPWNISTKIAR